jgi:UDP-glucose 4-epimerase
MQRFPGQYQTEAVDMIDGSWREKSFAGFDAVYHVAGIAHIRETTENAHLYYEVNRDLAVETARKAKADGVPQFIFLSSMSVYGIEEGCITRKSLPNPKSNYGKSKLQAEKDWKNFVQIISGLQFCVPLWSMERGARAITSPL